jgi:hypothetical protein
MTNNGDYQDVRRTGARIDRTRPRTWSDPVVDIVSTALGLARSRNDLVTRLNARLCEACGNRDGPFEVYHVRRLSEGKLPDDLSLGSVVPHQLRRMFGHARGPYCQPSSTKAPFKVRAM